MILWGVAVEAVSASLLGHVDSTARALAIAALLFPSLRRLLTDAEDGIPHPERRATRLG
ncbi:hypothetical protein [Arsenicicoccus dermatophilus]|uniref:hypothetical protein n=1 Tax=Arsenicicoccus dermatophilus TaxID=1076331 RepID=UPI001F4D0AF4|nr:hypothetical protein [Arsenicicoccus dermatophilus]MCH8612269.1 hypothetical protein [Arsenicicoccus dermatophilus]